MRKGQRQRNLVGVHMNAECRNMHIARTVGLEIKYLLLNPA